MYFLELLAPARNMEIGIAAIDCGADAVYIAGPSFGARKDAGNEFEDIAQLCSYAHRYGARIFLTVNTIIADSELEAAHSQMLRAQEAGVDAFIIRDMRITGWKDITVPLHASTQCAIRSVERARELCSLGCARIILERELDLETIKEICGAVDCEVEFFVHGALCVCYSGECRLSEAIDGRSADKGECIQACRSLYDLEDGDGRVLVRNKALLSLKDYNLRSRLSDLAEAGVTSFKIEGRLKNASYVKNVVRDYSLALDELVRQHPDEYSRASFGHVRGGFIPRPDATFNRGYTELWLDGERARGWSSMDAPKSMGEAVGEVTAIKKLDPQTLELTIKPFGHGAADLRNGDGFAFVAGNSIVGFRGDVCEGNRIRCKSLPEIHKGIRLFRNINSSFEKELEKNLPKRELEVELDIKISGSYVLEINAVTEDGREFPERFDMDVEKAENRERAEAMIREQLGKRSGIYNMNVRSLEVVGSSLPLLSASTLNSIRRLIAGDLDGMPCGKVELFHGTSTVPTPVEAEKRPMDPLMRSRYCVRYELGMCPVRQGFKNGGPLYLLNNGRRFRLDFDCRACEMTVRSE